MTQSIYIKKSPIYLQESKVLIANGTELSDYTLEINGSKITFSHIGDIIVEAKGSIIMKGNSIFSNCSEDYIKEKKNEANI